MKRYNANYSSADQKYYVNGPCGGAACSFYGGTLDPESRFDSEEEANRSARFANIGYLEGYKQAQKDILKSMGILDILKEVTNNY